MGVDSGGHLESGLQPDTSLETHKVLESDRRPPPPGGVMPALPTASVQPEVPDTLLAMPKGASIIDEHRVLMGALIEKIQSVESGLNESCISLIRGFEVYLMSFWESVMVWIAAPNTLFGERNSQTRDHTHGRRRLT